jgi:hypothetical protein
MKVAVHISQIISAKTKVTNLTKIALKQETYNLSDLKHDLHCGFKFVELGSRLGLGGLMVPKSRSQLEVEHWQHRLRVQLE